MNKVRSNSKCTQSGARTTKFHREKSGTQTLKRTSCESRCTKPARFEKWPKEGLLLFAQLKDLFLEQEMKNTFVRLLGRFLKTKVEDRKVEAISAVELNEYISRQFIISVAPSTSQLRFEV